MIIELSTGKKIKLNGKEYKELVEHICKKYCKTESYLHDSAGLYPQYDITDYARKYGKRVR